MLNTLRVQIILTGLYCRVAYSAETDPFQIIEKPYLEC